MFNKKVIIYDDGLQVKKYKFLWKDVIGMRCLNNKLLRTLHYQFPHVELFINDENVIHISNIDSFVDKSSSAYNYNNYVDFIIDIVNKESLVLHKHLNKHFEWRLLLPMFIAQILSTITLVVYNDLSLNNVVSYGLISPVLGLPVGWFWEHGYRRQLINQALEIIKTQNRK